jgi:hypothetical protein
MDPKVVNDVHDSGTTDTSAFGDIYITGVLCRDEPHLDASSWWGWNLRTLGADVTGKDDEKRMFLPDLNNSFQQGMSLALNNSTTKDVLISKTSNNASDAEIYRRHIPFLQTPTFATNIVGEVSFKARKYDTSSSQPAQVTIYGSRTGSDDVMWDRLGHFIVTNDFYTTYTYKTSTTENYNAFRLAVTGVENVTDSNMSNRAPESYDNPVRVLIDEVVVSEAVRVRMAFRNVGAFRSLMTDIPNIMNTSAEVPNVPSEERQPLSGENWGIQCEIYPAQLAEEIDLIRVPRVRLIYFPHNSPWGYENWKNDSRAKEAYLGRVSDTNLIYRSSFVTAPNAVLSASPAAGSVVQYMLEVEYYQKGKNEPMTNKLSSAEWVKPRWYRGVDYNKLYGGASGAFAGYNILDTVAPGWA